MGTFIPHFLLFKGYDTRDVKIWRKRGEVEVILKREDSKPFLCHHCMTPLTRKCGDYRMTVRHLPLFEYASYLIFRRQRGYCSNCKKTRAEHVSFLSKASPHMTECFAWYLGKLCEISPVSNAAEFCSVNEMTTWRVDFKHMMMMLQNYKLPEVTQISVDEVYARKKARSGESRNDRFFTIITDLKTRKVIWVTESRNKSALDEFFNIIGPKACRKIRVVAMDQHDGYKASVKEHCPKAKVVWDRFHLMQSFNEVANEIRKEVHEGVDKESPIKRLTRGKYRFLFLKKSGKRSKKEQEHLEEVTSRNSYLLKLELIKERLHTFFDEYDLNKAWDIFDEIGDWIDDLGFRYLKDWYNRLERQWDVLANYFTFRVTTSVSEGINNVIKTLKRSAYGYRNTQYFKLKIMQKVGYLNSKYICRVQMT